jgi:hypothetical protein
MGAVIMQFDVSGLIPMSRGAGGGLDSLLSFTIGSIGMYPNQYMAQCFHLRTKTFAMVCNGMTEPIMICT